jgi:hypothetical protein
VDANGGNIKGGTMNDIVTRNPCRLDVEAVPTWEEAEVVTFTLDTMGRNIAWWWGDWLAYCESQFGEDYAQLIPDVGWDKKTLLNWKWVCSQVRKNGRYENLSFSHHAEIAKFDPEIQDMWLERAMEGGWTLKRLREEIRGPKKDADPKFIHCVCPECQHEFEETI